MLIEFGKLSYLHLIFLFIPISYKIGGLLNEYFEIKVSKNKTYLIFNEYFSMCISGITIHLMIQYFSKTTKEKENEQYHKEKKKELKALKDSGEQGMNQYQIIELNNIHKKKIETRKKFFFILLIAYIQLIGLILENFVMPTILPYSSILLCKNNAFLILSIFFTLFSIIFLRFLLHRHQYFALGIIFVSTIIFISQIIIYKENITIKDYLKGFLRLCIIDFFYCLHDVLGKKYLNMYIDGVYLYMSKFSLISGITLLIYDIIAYFCNVNEKYQGIIIAIKTYPFWWWLIIFIFTSIFDLGTWIIIYYFSPHHFIILKTLLDITDLIHTLIKNEVNKDSYVLEQKITFFILYPFIIFGLLVFNEILILNFWTLQYNTKQYISKRELLEREITNSLCSDDFPL